MVDEKVLANFKSNDRQPTVASPIEPVVSLQKLTINDIESWEYKGKTPNGRGWYFSKELDVCAYITGGESLKVCYNRKNHNSNAANSFYDCLVPFAN